MEENNNTKNTKTKGQDVQQKMQGQADPEMKKVWERHEKLIADLLDHLKNRRNVNMETNTLAKSLNESFKRLRLRLDGQAVGRTALGGASQAVGPARRTSVSSVQTSPRLNSVEPVLTLQKSDATKEHVSQKALTPRSKKTWKKRKERIPTSAEEEEADRLKRRKHQDEQMVKPDMNQVWQQVKAKKKVKKKRNRKGPVKGCQSPTVPNALIIRAREGKSYAEILRKVKRDVSSEQIGENISKVRRTNTEQLLIVLDKNSGDKAKQLRTPSEETRML